jgi:hypothetical protein
MNKYMATLGGGLGDVFVRLYQCSQYQILPLISKSIYIDCRVTCCNLASKSIIDSMLTVSGKPIFRDVFYRDMFFMETDEGRDWIKDYTDKGYLFIDDEVGWSKLFEESDIDNPFQYGYFHKTLHRHKYNITYQEQLFFERIPRPYIVIHPSGGLQEIDGLTRNEYFELIRLLLDSFIEYTFITIGATHSRSDSVHSINGIPAVMIENNFNMHHNRFIDLTNKTSGALCANIVENAIAFIGSHSAWMNMFWHFDKPTICVLSNDTSWGDAGNYVKTNGCKWGFELPQTSVVPVVDSIKEVYNKVIDELRGDLDY